MDILPLPNPLGLDAASVIHDPTTLQIKESSLQSDIRITDAWGRDVIYVHKHGSSLRKRHTFTNASNGVDLFELRIDGSVMVLIVIGRFHNDWILENAQGQEVAAVAYEKSGYHHRSWSISFGNTANKGERAVVLLRGDWTEPNPALMVGNMPAVAIERSGGGNYTAVVAPGVDLIWGASMIAIFELATRNAAGVQKR